MTNYLNRLVSRALPNPAVRTMTPSVAREAVAAVDDPFAAAPIVDEPGRAVAATRRAEPVSLASPAAVSRVTPLMSAPPPDAPPRREAAALVPVIAPPTIAGVPSGAPRDQPAAAWPSDASRERAPSPAASWTRLESPPPRADERGVTIATPTLAPVVEPPRDAADRSAPMLSRSAPMLAPPAPPIYVAPRERVPAPSPPIVAAPPPPPLAASPSLASPPRPAGPPLAAMMPAVPEPIAAAPSVSIGRLVVEVVAPPATPAPAPAPARVVVIQRGGDRGAPRSALLHRGFGLRQR